MPWYTSITDSADGVTMFDTETGKWLTLEERREVFRQWDKRAAERIGDRYEVYVKLACDE